MPPDDDTAAPSTSAGFRAADANALPPARTARQRVVDAWRTVSAVLARGLLASSTAGVTADWTYAVRVVAGELASHSLTLDHLTLVCLRDRRIEDLLESLGVSARTVRRALLRRLLALKPELDRSAPRTDLAGVTTIAVDRALMHAGRRAVARAQARPILLALDVFPECMNPEEPTFLPAVLEKLGISRARVLAELGQEPPPRRALPPVADNALVDVVLLNDDFTRQEFVVALLMEALDYDQERATARMLEVHNNGEALALTGSLADVKPKLARAYELCDRVGCPLRFDVRLTTARPDGEPRP